MTARYSGSIRPAGKAWNGRNRAAVHGIGLVD
jgi:hypothetical protein